MSDELAARFRESAIWTMAQLENNNRLLWGLDLLPEEEAADAYRARLAKRSAEIWADGEAR